MFRWKTWCSHPFDDLIVDEAHHLESAVTNGLSFSADRRFLETVLKEITSERSGLLADVLRRLSAAIPGRARERAGWFGQSNAP